MANLPPSSAFAQSRHGEQASWSTNDYLLAQVVDLLAAANWQRGGKGRRPKPIPRPGRTDEGGRQLGSASMTVDDAKRFFDRVNRA